MNRMLTRLALLGACLLTGSSLAAAPVTVIPLKPYIGLQTLHARVNGQDGVFFFDTGAGISIVTPEFAAAIGCKPWGQITGFRMSGQRLDSARCDKLDFDLGTQTVHAPIAAVFDLMALMPPDAQKISGILALDAFAGRALSIDESGGSLSLESRASLKARVKGAQEVPIRLVRDAGGAALGVDLAVTTPPGTAWMELDTGSDGALIIGKHLASLFGLDLASKKAQPLSLQLPGGVQLQGAAITKDLIMDGNIGSQVWKDWVVTIDLAAARMWLKPTQAAHEPQ